MNLDPEMRTLLKQLADNAGRLARAMEAILDAERLEELSEVWVRGPGAKPMEKDGGRMDFDPDDNGICQCVHCEARRAAKNS